MVAEHSDARSVTAYILVKTEPGAADAVAERLAETIEGALVRRVLGTYDIVMSLEADGQEYITAVMRDHVRVVDGVTDSEALIWYEEGPSAPAQGAEFRAA